MQDQSNKSMSLAGAAPSHFDFIQKVSFIVGMAGAIMLLLAFFGINYSNNLTTLSSSLIMITLGTLVFSWRAYSSQPDGIKNNRNWQRSLTNRGLVGWTLGILITGFYIILYYFPSYLGQAADGGVNTGLISVFDPLSQLLKGSPASQWFVYGTLYTLAIIIFGIKFIWKYRHNQYQILRTISVIFFQTGFAFLLPEFLLRLNYPYNDFKQMWPLNYYFFDEWSINAMLESGGLGLFMLIFGILMIFIISPVLTYFYGKRWYCSWVCGCGGLAETAGDPFRHLSSKSLSAWKVERWLIHSILLFSVIMTIGVLYSFFHNNPEGFWITKDIFSIFIITLLSGLGAIVWINRNQFNISSTENQIILGSIILVVILFSANLLIGSDKAFFIDSDKLRSHYGFFVGATFSGVIGVGFYPLMGSRVWCRFGCPMAAILGIQQRFLSRFRITTNGGQCISCGNCSTYCEMGIDVRSYAQKGQNIVRASCVGCGICSAVCPRGVLKLENGSVDLKERTTEMKTIHITESEIGLLQ